jgi:hypothetical protein
LLVSHPFNMILQILRRSDCGIGMGREGYLLGTIQYKSFLKYVNTIFHSS